MDDDDAACRWWSLLREKREERERELGGEERLFFFSFCPLFSLSNLFKNSKQNKIQLTDEDGLEAQGVRDLGVEDLVAAFFFWF